MIAPVYAGRQAEYDYGMPLNQRRASVVKMGCQQRERLMEQYVGAENKYTASTQAMRTLFGPEFWQAWRRFDHDRIAWQAALHSLESHEQKHGCIDAPASAESAAPYRQRASGSG